MENTNITINISPASFSRAQNDSDFRETIFKYAEDNVQNENEMDFVPIETEIGTDSVWVDAAVKLMLVLVAGMKPKVGKTFALKTKSKMWTAIEVELRTHGYNFTAAQVENKYRGLERNYKRVKSHNNKSGRGRDSCPYEKELGEILNNRPSVFPNTILGTARTDVLFKDDLIELGDQVEEEDWQQNTASTSQRRSQSPIPSCPPSARKSKNEEIANELRLLREDRQRQHEEIVNVLKQSSEERNTILKQTNEERTAILRERNNILKEFLELNK